MRNMTIKSLSPLGVCRIMGTPQARVPGGAFLSSANVNLRNRRSGSTVVSKSLAGEAIGVDAEERGKKMVEEPRLAEERAKVLLSGGRYKPAKNRDYSNSLPEFKR